MKSAKVSFTLAVGDSNHKHNISGNMKNNNIVSTTQVIKFPVDCVEFVLVEFVLPHGDGIYKLFVNPETLHLDAIQFWSDSITEENVLISSQHKALKQFCEDIDIHVEKNIPIPQKVWEVIKANQFRSLWFIDGLNIQGENK